MEPEPTLIRIRQVRQEISEQFGDDPDRLVAHYIDLQQRHRDRLVPSREPELTIEH